MCFSFTRDVQLLMLKLVQLAPGADLLDTDYNEFARK